jgi:YHS domain-containing protein
VGRSESLLQAIVARETQALGALPPSHHGTVQPASGELLVQYQQAAPATGSYQQLPQYEPSGQASGGTQSEVQRELQLLYQQDGREMPSMDIPQFSPEARRYAPVSGRRSRPWDFLNPAQWKRKFELNRRRPQPHPAEQVQTGAPAPLPQAQMPAPTVVPMPTAPAAQQPLPHVQRVSPEIFARTPSSPVDAPSAADQNPFAGQPGPFPGPVESAYPAVTEIPGDVPTESTSGAPLLIILPDPATAGPAADGGTLNEPQAAPFVDAPAAEPAGNGLPAWVQEEAAPQLNRPLPRLEESLDPTASDPLANPFPADSEAEADQQAGPYSGLQLEMDPYGEPLPSLPSATPSDRSPVIAPNIPSYDAEGYAPAADLPFAPSQGGGPLAAPGAGRPPAELPRVIPQQPLPVPQTGPTAPSAAAHSSNVADKMARIAARQGLKGFKGFCPVMLRDYRELADAKLEHSAIYQGNQYWFSSAEARQAFVANPGAYVPASGGIDVVLFQQTGRQELGSLDYAVWYRSRLFLFTSEATKAEFVSSPRTHALDQAAAP